MRISRTEGEESRWFRGCVNVSERRSPCQGCLLCPRNVGSAGTAWEKEVGPPSSLPNHREHRLCHPLLFAQFPPGNPATRDFAFVRSCCHILTKKKTREETTRSSQLVRFTTAKRTIDILIAIIFLSISFIPAKITLMSMSFNMWSVNVEVNIFDKQVIDIV